MKLEKHISKWYRFSSLKEVGKIGFLAIAIVTSLGIWPRSTSHRQMMKLKVIDNNQKRATSQSTQFM
jgi:hypothetical protein